MRRRIRIPLLLLAALAATLACSPRTCDAYQEMPPPTSDAACPTP